MKNSKIRRALLLAACAVLLVVMSVGATLAYLTDTDSVKNTFTVGAVKINLDEAEVDEYGKNENGRTEEGNEYKIMPGHEYIKDPTVTVKSGSEDCYVWLVVTITNWKNTYAELLKANPEDPRPHNFVAGWNWETWQSNGVEVDDAADTATVTFLYTGEHVNDKGAVTGALSADVKLEPLFTAFTVPGTVDEDNIAKLDATEIQIAAHAIQADGFDTAADAWNAYNTQN